VIRPKVVAALLAVQVIFGVHYFVAKLVLQMVPPRAWAAIRIAAGAIVLTGLIALRRRPRPARADLGRLAVFAFFGVLLNQWLFVEGLSRTTPSHSAVINSLIPVATLVFAMAFGHERTSWGRWLAIGVSFASVLVLLGVEKFRLDDRLVVGDLLTLANGFSFSLFLVLSREALRRLDPLVATTWLFWFAAAGILAVSGKNVLAVPFATLPARFWWLAAYVVVFATVLAYFLNYWALRHTDASMVALFIYVQPPIATALSMAFLGERPAPRFWIATAGIFLGVYLAARERRTTTGRSPAVVD